MKISREFSARLDRHGSDDMVRAVVLLRTDDGDGRAGRRRLKQQRGERAQAVGRAMAEAQHEVDRLLADYGGCRVSAGKANALGSLVVESTPAGLRALAESDRVRAVIEDQPISRAM